MGVWFWRQVVLGTDQCWSRHFSVGGETVVSRDSDHMCCSVPVRVEEARCRFLYVRNRPSLILFERVYLPDSM